MVIDPYVPATDLAERVRAGDVTPTGVAEAYLDRVEERDGEINAYVTVTDGIAREAAEAVERAIESDDDPGPLAGVPVALKDLGYMKEGVRHTFGSKVFADMGFEAPRTTVAVERLEAAGAVVIGKTNTPEFGHKGMTDNGVVGPTATPFDATKNAGGSSGGSAAAVAAGMAAAATGSDAGGSIRIPSALCGVFGLKPSFGLVPRDSRPNAFGGKTHHSVLGPITRTVADAALLMDVMAGPHPSDPSSVPVEPDYLGAVGRPIDGLRIGYSPDLEAFDVDPRVGAVVEDALGAFEAAGATVEQASVDHGLSIEELSDAVTTTFSTAMAGAAAVVDASMGVDLREHPDASDTLKRLFEVADGHGTEDVALTGVPRTRLFDAVQAVLGEYDLLVTPTVGTAGIDLRHGSEDHQEWVQTRVLTWPFNFTGHPAASVPAGLVDGLPVGTQVVGRRYEDDAVIAASAAVERERPWHDRYP